MHFESRCYFGLRNVDIFYIKIHVVVIFIFYTWQWPRQSTNSKTTEDTLLKNACKGIGNIHAKLDFVRERQIKSRYLGVNIALKQIEDRSHNDATYAIGGTGSISP